MLAKQRAKRAENREQYLADGRSYYARNRERILAQMAEQYRNDEDVRERKKRVAREHRLANLDHVRELKRSYYLANRDAINAKCSAYYEAHREEIGEANKAWRERNPERVSLNGRNRKARRRAREAGGRVTRTDLREILEEFGMHCHLCDAEIATLDDLHFDHVAPLARGGAHSPENIRPAHAVCNLRKGDRVAA